jgi:hypothetical protein
MPSLRAPLGRTLPAYMCAHAIAQGYTPRGRVLLIGDDSSGRAANAIGLTFDQRLTPPLGKLDLMARTVRKMAREFDRVVCWDDELTPLLRGMPCPVDLISTRPDLATRRVSTRVHVRVFEREDRTAWESRNTQAELDSVLHRLIQDPAMPKQDSSRAALGIEPGSICVGIIADRPSDIDARSIGFLMGLLNVAGFELTAVAPHGSSHLVAARRHHHGLGNHFRFMVAQDPIITMLPVFDLLIHPCYDGSGASSLIERLCENLETPVLRLTHGGRAGLSRAPGVAGPIVETLDDLLATRAANRIPRETEIHA